MKYYIDTEFSERGPKHPIEIISIGIVAEDGRELYLCNADFNPKHANDWVREHVLPLLPCQNVSFYDSPRLRMAALAWVPFKEMSQRIWEFITDPDPEFWGYYCDFDYVVFSQLFGGMAGYPSHWPYSFRDLRQYLDHEGLDHVRQPDDAPHDALQDARWIAETQRIHSNDWEAA